MSRKNWTDEKLFFRLINNKSDKTYWDNVRELRSRANENIFKSCIKLTKSSIPKERIIAIDILAQLGLTPRPFDKESKKVFFDFLKKEKNLKVLFSTLYAIGHNNDKLTSQDVELICSFQKSKNEGIRESLVSALLSVDTRLAIETLINLTNDKAAHIRDWATFGIGTQIDRDNKIIRGALWKRVDDKNQETKLEAILGLAKRKDNRVKEIIERELMNGEYGILLFEAIEELKDKDFIPFLEQNLKKAKVVKGVKPEWIKDLKVCIHKLQQS